MTTAAVNRHDLVEASKAIYGEAKRVAVNEVKSLAESLNLRVKSLEDGVAGLGEKLQDFDADTAVRIGKIFQKEFEERHAAFEKRLESAERAHAEAIKTIVSLLKALPVPQVILPEGSINIKMIPSQVTLPKDSITIHVEPKDIVVNVPKLDQPTIEVNVPQQSAPVVNVPALAPPTIEVNVPKLDQPTIHLSPEVRVNVPKQAPPKVEINVPEGKAPEVNVNVPRRLVKKTFTYDEQGRPAEVREEEISD